MYFLFYGSHYIGQFLTIDAAHGDARLRGYIRYEIFNRAGDQVY